MLRANGKEKVLYTFTGGADGRTPFAGLVRDSAGNLYGTTYEGGASGVGVVFKLDTTGAETVLYSFTGRADGRNPSGDLVQDSAGDFYGTTTFGGDASCTSYGCGVVAASILKTAELLTLDTCRKKGAP
ncbi:MAG: choice-of-anchor tandem repeat GloVer-containing protein [Terriglobales bacterium]